MIGDPASVLTGKNCAVCWRSFNVDTIYSQTLDGVTRRLCSGCYSLFFPALPPGVPDDARVVHLDAKAMLAEAERRHATSLLGDPQEKP